MTRQLTWSHFIEIIPIEDEQKGDFYATLCLKEKCGVRTLRERRNSMLYERTAILKKPEATIANELRMLREHDKMSVSLNLEVKLFEEAVWLSKDQIVRFFNKANQILVNI